MESKAYVIYNKNKTTESPICSGIPAVDSAREPLTALRVMIEGLESQNETGLWLTHVTSFPGVPRLSPFDVVYLDKNHRVVDRFELLPAAEIPRFKSPAHSALILPFQTISSAGIDPGDELFIDLSSTDPGAQDGEHGAVSEVYAEEAAFTESVSEAGIEPPEAQVVDAVAEPFVDRTAHGQRPDLILTITEAPESAVASNEVSMTVVPQRVKAAKRAAAKDHAEGPAFKRQGKRKGRGKRQAFHPVTKSKPSPRVKIGKLQERGDLRQQAADAVPSPEASEVIAAGPLEILQSPDLAAAPDAFCISVVAENRAITEASAVAVRSETETAESRGGAEQTVRSEPTEAPGAANSRVIAAAQMVLQPGEGRSARDESVVNGVDRAPEPLGHESEMPHAASAAGLPVASAKSAPALLSSPVFKPALTTRPAPAPEKAETPLEKRPMVHRLLRWLYPSMYDQDRRQSLRRPLAGLVAYNWSGSEPQKHEIGNISSTGIYLLTKERWEPGSTLSLTLQRSGPFEQIAERRVDIEAGAVRWGNDGVGLSFVWPDGMDLRLWETPLKTGLIESESDYVVREMRTARALALFRRICPAVTDQVKRLLNTELSNVRVANSVEIALKAEKLLAHEPNADKMFAHPDVILRILESGSWIDVDWMQQLWAGLLATSCTVEGQDDSNLVYIDLLSLLAPIHARILSVACAKAMSVMATSDAPTPHLIASSAEEMARLTGSTNLMKVHRSIAELSDLGLLEKSTRASLHSLSTATRTRPTHLGLEMYVRCSGERGAA
jgi:hypothetical protein